MSHTQHSKEHHFSLSTMTIAAIGIVFGDIGTSPLYSLKEAFSPAHGIALTHDNILGVISLIFWALIIVVCIKYAVFVMRADNNGEGGILALTALALRSIKHSGWSKIIIGLGILGASMFYGDAVITPAMSVLSAVEGMEIATPHLSEWILPITIIILVLLFWIQRHGTALVGRFFGPVMTIWFITIATLGITHIALSPAILKAINPYYAISFMANHVLSAYIVLGSVVLVLTGAEALYADMGHFGALPIRIATYTLVVPALVLNYFGQGALLMHSPEAIQNPFFLLAPSWALIPLIILATIATIIASQAVISGAYSLTSQAIQLGYLPRMKILHTSDSAIGQIYIPVVNWLLLAVILCIVLGFKSSTNLAAAYGLAVTATMVITTILVCIVMINLWHWNKILVFFAILIFATLDLGFFGANLLKVKEGGWLPLCIGFFLFFLLTTWYKGRQLLREKSVSEGIPLIPFITSLLAHPPHRVSGTAIYLTGSTKNVPVSLLHNLKHNKVLHEQVIILNITTLGVPYVKNSERLETKDLTGGVYLVHAQYGFNETPDVRSILMEVGHIYGLTFDLMDTTFFIARETVIPTDLPNMFLWRERVFAWMHQNAAKPTDFFKIPANRVVELGTKVEL